MADLCQRVLVIDLYVIELRIFRGRADLHWTNAVQSVAYIKLPGGINKMPPSMIEQRVRRGRVACTDLDDVETTAARGDAIAETKGKISNRQVDSSGQEYVIVTRPSVTFTCHLPMAFGRGAYGGAGGEIEFRTGDYRGLRVSLPGSEIRKGMMRGLRTSLSCPARPYLRPIDAELTEVTLGNAIVRLGRREVRDLCQCIDHAVSLYKQDLIETEDALDTWHYEFCEAEGSLGSLVAVVPKQVCEFLLKFANEFSPSERNSEWHIFEHSYRFLRIEHPFVFHAWLRPIPYGSPCDPYNGSLSDLVTLLYDFDDQRLARNELGQHARGRDWVKGIGKGGVWTVKYTGWWLLAKLLPKVLDHYQSQIPSEDRATMLGVVEDFHRHERYAADRDDLVRLPAYVHDIQGWLNGAPNRVSRELILPYYRSLLTLAVQVQSKRTKCDLGYIGGNLDAAVSFVSGDASTSPRHWTWDAIVDELRFHVDRMNRALFEESIRADFISRVFIAILEAQPPLSQREINEVKRGVDPIWREARFEQHHVLEL